MAFYKKENEELMVAPNFVRSPNYDLLSENQSDYDYPVDGWYWFESLDEALLHFAAKVPTQGVSPRQIRQAMNRVPYGEGTLRDAVESAIASANQDLKDWWLYSTIFDRDNHQVQVMANALGVSTKELDDLWALARQL